MNQNDQQQKLEEIFEKSMRTLLRLGFFEKTYDEFSKDVKINKIKIIKPKSN